MAAASLSSLSLPYLPTRTRTLIAPSQSLSTLSSSPQSHRPPRNPRLISPISAVQLENQTSTKPSSSNPRPLLPFRVGHGFDLHRLEPGLPLIIGGIDIPHDRGCDAHSDGDVLLHCVVDAILGALGLPDIGQIFPDSDPKWRGAASSVFMIEARAPIARSCLLSGQSIPLLSVRMVFFSTDMPSGKRDWLLRLQLLTSIIRATHPSISLSLAVKDLLGETHARGRIRAWKLGCHSDTSEAKAEPSQRSHSGQLVRSFGSRPIRRES